jgi:two-component SAPR family response regulator
MQTKPIQCAWVIDDDPLQVLILNRLLSANQSVKTTKFFSGAKAALDVLVTLKSKTSDLPDLVFLDLVMSKGDGWDFLDQYKKLKPKLGRAASIVVISSFNEENYKRLKQYPDVAHYLSKPIDVKAFEELLEGISLKHANT